MVRNEVRDDESVMLLKYGLPEAKDPVPSVAIARCRTASTAVATRHSLQN